MARHKVGNASSATAARPTSSSNGVPATGPMTTATTTTQSLSESEPVAAAPTMDDVEPDKASNDDRFPLLHARGSHERLLPDVVHDGESSGAAAIGIDAADPPEAYAYPRAVAYIVGNEFCERFSFYGMRTILFIYLNNFLAFEETAARAILHVFIMFAYFFPLLGGVLSDSYLGKFWTIFYLSLVYCVGNIVLAVTAIPGVTGTPPHWWGAALGLGLLALGTGGIKPCVSAFGGDQFHPSQTTEIQSFFSLFYFAINAGSVLSTFLTPELRSMSCLGVSECFPLAFGVPAVLMLCATGIFVAGYKLYKITPPTGNVLSQVMGVIRVALARKRMTPRSERIAYVHWLDYAVPTVGAHTVVEIKSLFSVLYMFLPLPFFWTLFDQQSSFWVEQAQKMKLDVDVFGLIFRIKPDQMQLTNALLILLMIPLFDRVVYPMLRRLGMPMRPLTRMASGMFLTGCAFLLSGALQARVDRSIIRIVMDGTVKRIECVDQCVSILWQIPPYIVITAGEIMFSVTGLEFAYSQAPKSMKSVCQACWLLTVAIGNLVVVIVAGAKIFAEPYMELLFYSALIFAAMLVFMAMSRSYRYVEDVLSTVIDEDEDKSTENVFNLEPGLATDRVESQRSPLEQQQ